MQKHGGEGGGCCIMKRGKGGGSGPGDLCCIRRKGKASAPCTLSAPCTFFVRYYCYKRRAREISTLRAFYSIVPYFRGFHTARFSIGSFSRFVPVPF